ncbi:PqqD family protein [Paenibacillus sp. FSL M7-0420]|uniref:PqqD family protein n=1 Tax=Paenibacillus sp. FSL M7-0420 TaxID=2921609 RepID=UPI0030F8546B
MLYRRSHSVVIQEVGYEEEIMVYDIEKGMLHFVNASAAEILKIVEQEISLEGIISKISYQYDVEQEMVAEDVQHILEQFIEKDIVQVMEA